MAQTRFKNCFISAPLTTDTSVLRQALADSNIEWFDQTTIESGTYVADAVDQALTQSDFVCVVLPDGERGRVLFELGMAYAKRKPVLAFLGLNAGLPVDIVSLTYVRVDLSNRDAVKSALSMFLEHATPKPRGRTGKAVARPKPKLTLPSAGSTAIGYECEQRTAQILEEAGFILSWSPESHDRGADFAIWIDDLQHSLGNPLLVEVKAGNLTLRRINEAASQLRAHVSRVHGGGALLVYWDQSNREYPFISAEWPLIFQLSGPTLTRLVHEGRLIDELLRLRNDVVHRRV
jgi:hypothetical protein